jgi:hypothetical protein
MMNDVPRGMHQPPHPNERMRPKTVVGHDDAEGGEGKLPEAQPSAESAGANAPEFMNDSAPNFAVRAVTTSVLRAALFEFAP